MSALPSRVRDYEVWGRLGEGGMSNVWLAKHAVLAVPLIVKTLKAAPHADDSSAALANARVLDEARLMARITDPRVVRAIDAGIHDGVPFLVEEYVDGIDLAELDRRRRASLGVGLPLWFVALTMQHACEALHAAHQAGVIHRDVKPSNLFFAADSGVHLGDFGIAVASSEDRRERGGTLHFMAPEQLEGGEYSRRTDVWGAAATACDLRYGAPPFERVSDVFDPQFHPVMPPPHSSAEAYFQHTLCTMLARDPSMRPGQAVEPARQFETLYHSLEGARRLPFVWIDRHTFRVGDCTVTMRAGDVADARADAIVSSANCKMEMRTGSAEALRLRGGDDIEAEALASGEQPLGSCIATTAGRLRAKHVIHAVSAWNEASCIGRATQRALLLADELGVRSIATPALGTGAARVTLETCANAMMSALRWHLNLGGTRLRQVDIVLADDERLRIYREVAEEALRERTTAHSAIDLGLPVTSSDVRVEGATFIDPSSTRKP